VTGFVSRFAICSITVHLKKSACLSTEEIFLNNTAIGSVGLQSETEMLVKSMILSDQG